MNMGEGVQQLIDEIKNTPLLEWLGVSFGVAEVLFAKANKVWLYPTGIISVLITCYLFYHSQLYAESLLNIYYFVMSVYGWWFWVFKRNITPLPITTTNKREWIITSGIVIGGFGLLYFVLKNYTDSNVPVIDAWVSATAWAGMWLLAKRKLENWILLNISNAFAIPLLFYKGLPLYGLLTVFLFVIAIQGYFKWKRIIAHEPKHSF
ncbi:MAG: nicotinamide riboside transporter PnuC [Niabella sp.]